MAAKRYALHPGRVFSHHCGRTQFVSAPKLARMYGVCMSQCVIVEGAADDEHPELVHLHPRSDGNYSLDVAESEAAA